MNWRNLAVLTVSLALFTTLALRPDPEPRQAQSRSDFTVADYEDIYGHGLRAIEQDMFTSVRSTVTDRTPRLSSITINCTGCTAQALNVFNYAANIWATVLSSPVPMVFDVAFAPLAPGVLGSAGPKTFFRGFTNAPSPNTFFPVAIANANAGVDLLPGGSDVNSSYSSTFPFYFGTDGNPPAGMFDLASVALHEFGHGTGFVGSGGVDSGVGFWGLGGGFPTIYDLFVRDAANQYIVSAYPNESAALAAVFQSGSLFFNSPASPVPAVAAPIPLYAPNPFEGGSSYSHLNEASFPAGDPNSLMTPQIGQAEANHQPGAITLAMYSDMGWPGGAVPPPPPPGGLPGAPPNFTAVAAGNTVNMMWGASAVLFEPADKAAATGYNVKARLSAGGPVIFNQPVGNVTQFSAQGPDGTFVLSVTGTNAAGEGPESNQVTVTLPGGGGPPACTAPPNPPVNVTNNVTNGDTVTITWVDGGGCPATSYVLQATAGGVQVANTNVGNTLQFAVPGVPSGQYVVTVLGANAFGTSAPSAPTVVNVP